VGFEGCARRSSSRLPRLPHGDDQIAIRARRCRRANGSPRSSRTGNVRPWCVPARRRFPLRRWHVHGNRRPFSTKKRFPPTQDQLGEGTTERFPQQVSDAAQRIGEPTKRGAPRYDCRSTRLVRRYRPDEATPDDHRSNRSRARERVCREAPSAPAMPSRNNCSKGTARRAAVQLRRKDGTPSSTSTSTARGQPAVCPEARGAATR